MKICLLTKDASLKKELSSVLPKGFRIVKSLPEDAQSLIFLDST